MANNSSRYHIEQKLSAGSYGTVLLAKDLRTEQLVALKCTSLESGGSSEVDLLRKIRHAGLHELSTHPGRNHVVKYLDSFEFEGYMFAVLEHCSRGDLYQCITSSRMPKDSTTIRELILQLIDAVEFCHLVGVYHRDIKPENVLITMNAENKSVSRLADFGLATSETWTHETGTGSDRYQAPEQYDTSSEGYIPAKADIWALGITILNIIFGRNPWKLPAPSDFIFADFVRDSLSLGDVFPTLSQDLFSVLSHALAIDPAKRDLTKLRAAVLNLQCWTTDEEDIGDIFSLEQSTDSSTFEAPSVDTILGEREPLRTPSVSSGITGSFPWAKALRSASKMPQPTIFETLSETKPHDSFSHVSPVKVFGPRTSDSSSSPDSGLGLSISTLSTAEVTTPKSAHKVNRASATPQDSGKYNFLYKTISASVPVKANIPNIKRGTQDDSFAFSASWSDMLEEEESMQKKRLDRHTSSGGTDTKLLKRQSSLHQRPQRLRTYSESSSSKDSVYGGTNTKGGVEDWDGMAVGLWEDDENEIGKE